jgi:hypothetical protein
MTGTKISVSGKFDRLVKTRMGYGPETTFRVTLLELYCTAKCSLLLMEVPFTVAKVPLREL